MWLESIQRGTSVTVTISLTAFTIISFSSIPFIPILTSNMEAPFSVCSSAIVSTRSSIPSLNSACRSFFPVGLIRSPIIIKGLLRPISRVFRSEARVRFFRCVIPCGFIKLISSFSSFICSGVVPQHPPTRLAPAFTNSLARRANSSGLRENTVSFSTSSGSPALGFAIIGILAYSFRTVTISHICSGPVEQFTPTASTPSPCSTVTAVAGSVP